MHLGNYISVSQYAKCRKDELSVHEGWFLAVGERSRCVDQLTFPSLVVGCSHALGEHVSCLYNKRAAEIWHTIHDTEERL